MSLLGVLVFCLALCLIFSVLCLFLWTFNVADGFLIS